MTQDDIIKNPLDYDLSIETVGKGTLKSPMNGVPFVSENDKVSLTTDVNLISAGIDFVYRRKKRVLNNRCDLKLRLYAAFFDNKSPLPFRV